MVDNKNSKRWNVKLEVLPKAPRCSQCSIPKSVPIELSIKIVKQTYYWTSKHLTLFKDTKGSNYGKSRGCEEYFFADSHWGTMSSTKREGLRCSLYLSYERGTPERLLRERNKHLLRLAGQGIRWRRVWSHLRNRRGEAGYLASDGWIEGKLAVLGVTAPPEFMEAGRLQWFHGPDVHREGQSPWCFLGACLMGPTEREGSQASAERSWR